MRIVTILIAIFFSTGLFAQADKLTLDSKKFISNRMRIYEPNPIHKDLSESIDKRFQDMLISFPNCKLDTGLFARLLIDNSVTDYEDSNESYRYSVRRCLIYSLFAMSLPPDKANLFIDLAEKSLLNHNNQVDSNLIDKYSGILIMELFVMDSKKTLYSFAIKQIKEKFKKIQSSIAEPIYDQGLKIIKSYETKTKD